MRFDAIVIGGGAAGLMCAAVAGQRGLKVLVVEHANRVGKKILMSGGGRCNFTNLDVRPEHYLSANPHFCKSALARYRPADFIALVERYQIRYHEKERGQLFCDESSKDIVRLLLDECRLGEVHIQTECKVDRVLHSGEGFELHTSQGRVTAPKLVVACGGLSIPKMGATGFGYALARQFGHRLLPTRAGLVPLTFNEPEMAFFRDLAGVALEVEARCNGQHFRGGLLVTHRGVSGPAILQISSYWKPGDDLRLDLLPTVDAPRALAELQASRPAAELRNVLAEWIPKRLAQRLCETRVGSQPMRQYRIADLRELALQLQNWPLAAGGTEGYRTAEVTLGGVDVNELSSATLQSRLLPGLHFIGEVIDVTGHLGGYNFQWAWASGQAAGQAL